MRCAAVNYNTIVKKCIWKEGQNWKYTLTKYILVYTFLSDIFGIQNKICSIIKKVEKKPVSNLHSWKMPISLIFLISIWLWMLLPCTMSRICKHCAVGRQLISDIWFTSKKAQKTILLLEQISNNFRLHNKIHCFDPKLIKIQIRRKTKPSKIAFKNNDFSWNQL